MDNLYSNRINTLKIFGIVLFLVFFNIKVFAQSIWIGGAGNWNVPTNWNPNGVPNATTNVLINSGNPNLAGIVATMNNLTVDGVTLTINNSSFTVNGTTTITNNGTLTDNNDGGTNTFIGLVTVNPGGSFNITSNSQCIFRNGITNNGTFSKTGTGNTTFNTNAQTITANSPITIAGATTFSIGTTLSGASNITFNNNVTVGASVICNNQNTGIVQINGTLNGGDAASTWINNTNSYLRYLSSGSANAPMATGVLNATANPNTVEYYRAGDQTIKQTNYHHLILSQSGFKTFIANTIDFTTNIGGKFILQNTASFRGTTNSGDLTMTVVDSFIVRGGTFDFSSGSDNGFTYVTVGGHFIHTGGTITSTRTAGVALSDSRIVLNGSSVQHIQGGGAWAGTGTALQRGRLVINNANGVQCVGTVPINIANLELLNGVITATSTAFPNITGSAGGAVSGTFSNISAIEGKLQRAMANNGIYSYPLKKGSLFQTLVLSTASAGNAGTLAYELFNANTGGTYNTFFFTGLVNNGMYWKAEASSTVSGNLQISAISPLLDTYSMANSTTLTGTYTLLGGSAADPVLSNVPVAMSANAYYMTLAVLGNLSGVIPVGNSHPVTKLTTIAAALNAMTVTGNVIFELQADYDGTVGESFPIHFYQFKTSGGAHTAIVRPAAGVTGVETSNSSGTPSAQIVFNGVDRLTFDGRPGGVGTNREWLFWNAINNQSIFRFINSSDTVTIKNLNIASQNASVSTASTAGVIRIEMTGASDGQDFLTIENCKIYPPNPALANRWAYGIYMHAGGGASVSNYIYIKNCEFDNISLVNNGQYAIGGGNISRFNQIHITDNSLYQSIDETNSLGIGRITAGFMRVAGRNIFVKRNYLGGKAAFCAGAPYTVTNPVNNNTFLNIRFLHINAGTSDSLVVEGNVMQNIDFSSNSWNSNNPNDPFEPILNGLIVQNGGPSRIVGNSFGDATGLTDIIVRIKNTNGGDRDAMGVRAYDLDFGGTTTASGIFENNVATNIKLRHLAVNDSVTLQFEGIVVGPTANFSSISNNTINQINTDITNPKVLMIQRGILYKSSNSCALGNNTVGNFINNASGGSYTSDSGHKHVPECVGLKLVVPNSASSQLRVSKNKFYNFESAVTGLTVAAVNIKKIPAQSGNLVLLSNNMITMGFGNSSDIRYVGVLLDENNPSSAKVKLFYNTILITGPGAGPSAIDTNDTYCVYRKGAANATPIEIRNCIIYNNRLQGKDELHLTFATDNTTNWTSARNLFFAGNQNTPPLPADTLARWGTTLASNLADWQTASSQDPPPSFVGPVYFFDPANGNLTPLGSNLCQLFQSIAQPITNPPFDFNISDDHFDVARHATNPVPGAVEFSSIGYWTGVKSTEWNDTQNWCNGIIPDSTIIVYIVDLFQPTPRWYPVIDSGTIANCRDLIITNGEGTHLGTQAICSSPFCIYPTHDSWPQNALMPFTNLSAKLTIGSGGRLRVHGNMQFHTTPSDDSSFIHTAGTIEFVGRNSWATTQNIPAYLKYKNVRITGDNIKVMLGNVTIQDTLTINPVPALSLANHTLTCNGILMGGGDLIGSTNSNLIIGGTSGGNFGTLRFRNVGQGRSLNNLNIIRSGANASVSLGTTVNVHNKLTLVDGQLINNGLDFTLLKDMEVTNVGAAHVGNGRAIFRNTNTGTAYQMLGNGNFGNVEINDGNGVADIVTLVNHPTVNNFTISNGRFNHGANTLTVTGNWTRATSNTNYDEGTGTAVFAGTGLQTITCPTQVGETFYNFTANKPSNSIRLSSGTDLDVTNQLTLTSGIITFTNLADTVKISNVGSIVGGNANSYVSGKLSYTRSSSSMQNMPFPVGKSGRYRPVTLEADATTSATTRYTTEQMEAAASGLGYTINAPIQNVSGMRYFKITQSPANTLDSGRVTLSYSSDDGVVIPALLRIVKSQAGAWLNLGGQGTGISSAPVNTFDQTITSNINFTTFSDFALATEDLNPLPMQLLSFTAQLRNKDGLLNWKTASESNSSHFVVERSVNGKDFTAIGTVQAVGYSRSLQSYHFIDEKVTDLNLTKVYYRLKQVDLDGKTTQSRVIVLLINATQEPYFSVYPNPFSQEILIDLAVNNAENATIQLTDVTGKLVTQQVITLQKGLFQGKITLAETIANGVYLLSVQTADKRFVQKLIKQ